MSEDAQRIGSRLNTLLSEAGLGPLPAELCDQFAAYYSLLIRWNARVSLTAIGDEDGILRRHFVESIACARALPAEVGTVLDFGSGAGFPGIPIALCRPEISVTLAESQGKKAAFLQEAVRVVGIPAKVYAGRAETLGQQFDCVTMRAVDRMPQAVRAAAKLVRPGGWLAPMTTVDEREKLRAAAGAEFDWTETVALPGGESRVLALAQRKVSLPVR
jgi:16S rRNA (guanine527-N7)-methyltransferase